MKFGPFALVDVTWRRLNLQIQAFLAFCLPVVMAVEGVGWLVVFGGSLHESDARTWCWLRGQWTLVVQPEGRTSDPIYLSSSSAAAAAHCALVLKRNAGTCSLV